MAYFVVPLIQQDYPSEEALQAAIDARIALTMAHLGHMLPQKRMPALVKRQETRHFVAKSPFLLGRENVTLVCQYFDM